MTDFKARPDEKPNPYAPPRAEPPSPAESVIRDYRVRAGVIRIIAMLHFFFALCLIPAIIGPIVGGIDTWRRFENNLGGPPLESALVAFAMGTLSLILNALSAGVAIGLWRFRHWASRLARLQGFFVLALGLSVATYQLFRSGEPSGLVWMLPGVVLLLLAGFIRSPRSTVVCSDAYRNARTAIARARP